MKRLVVLIALLLIMIASYSQHQFSISDVPLFKSAIDSVAYTQSQQLFQQIVAGKINNMSADSVLKQMRVVAERSIIGRKKTYFASSHFLTYDSLSTIKNYSQVINLSITGAKTKRLPREVFRCKNLEYLELVNVPVRRIQKLKKLSKLKSIYVLNSNQLKSIKLSETKSVKTFGIRGENPSALPVSFKKLSNLEKLDLADNKLTQFPSGIKGNKSLTELLLSNNLLTLNDGWMEESASLEKLELQRNSIKHLPSAIAQFPKLKKLTLNFNVIETVAPEIASLTQLEQLSFYNNRLTSIPDGVYALSALKEVDLYFNQIERVDQRIGNLTSLEVLYLSNNKIMSVSESIGNLSKLTELYLSNNRLSDLPASLHQLVNLKILRLNNNYLTQLQTDLLKLNKLENIDISNNMITDLPEDVEYLDHLKLLVMVNNPWDPQAKERLPAFAERLRKKEIVVHSD
jgi:Leucine-rich repeat (LRR) protein